MAMLNLAFKALVKHYRSPPEFSPDGDPNTEPVNFNPVGTALILCAFFGYLLISWLVSI
jgi:hypothetical protein